MQRDREIDMQRDIESREIEIKICREKEGYAEIERCIALESHRHRERYRRCMDIQYTDLCRDACIYRNMYLDAYEYIIIHHIYMCVTYVCVHICMLTNARR